MRNKSPRWKKCFLFSQRVLVSILNRLLYKTEWIQFYFTIKWFQKVIWNKIVSANTGLLQDLNRTFAQCVRFSSFLFGKPVRKTPIYFTLCYLSFYFPRLQVIHSRLLKLLHDTERRFPDAAMRSHAAAAAASNRRRSNVFTIKLSGEKDTK